jgi:RimJ/RimL family protein N-acetyltransferase
MCTSVLAGIYPGKIFVDDPEKPRSALLSTYIESEQRSIWGFLAGEPGDEAFNQDLNHAIFNGQITHSDTPVILLTCDPDDWGGQMEVVMSPRPPIWMKRWHYLCRDVNYDWRSSLPAGFAVLPMQIEMLESSAMDFPGDVRATLEKWASAKNEHFADFGFLTVDQDGEKPIIAGWATVDFVAQGMGDLGFFTQPDYRLKGLGTVAAAAALEYGLSNGLTQINWTCAAGNQGSIHTADKLGLERIGDYQMAMLFFNEAEHMGSLGYFALQAENFTQAASAFQQALELNPESAHFIYFEAAQAMAMIGNQAKALDYLEESINRGWKDAQQAQECKAFASLQKLPTWEKLIQKMQ